MPTTNIMIPRQRRTCLTYAKASGFFGVVFKIKLKFLPLKKKKQEQIKAFIKKCEFNNVSSSTVIKWVFKLEAITLHRQRQRFT